MGKSLTIKNAGASNGKGMNFCLNSVHLKIVHHYCANEIILNSLYYGSSGLGAL
jgi:hypothetical protein